jgi:TRAP-type mannitol/chloroaromatic compound transport system substrate-binding protein
MKKHFKRSCFYFIAFAITLITACSGGRNTASNSNQPIKWRAQGPENSGTARFECVKYFCDKLSEASNGRFTIELYTADALFPTMQAVDAVKNGVIESAFTSGDYQGGKEPMLKLQTNRPADPWNDYETAEEFFQRNEYLGKQAWTNMGIVYAGTVQMQPNEAFHASKRISSVADFKGLKVRSAGLGQELYQALGASVVNMPMGDIYQAIKLNTIDAFEAGGYVDNYQNALQEVSAYSIEPALHCSSAIMADAFIIRPSVWDDLPDDIKSLIPDLAKDTRKYSYYFLEEKNKEFKKKFEEAGVETLTLPAAEIAKAKNAAAQTLKEYWGTSELSDQILEVYVEFLNEKGYTDLAKIIAR